MKFKHTRFRISIGNAAGSTPIAVTSITAGITPLVNAAAHGLATGDVIVLKGTGSFQTDGPYLVEVVDTSSFYLLNANWENRDNLTGASITATKQALMQFCDLTDVDINDREMNYTDEETMCGTVTTGVMTLGTISGTAIWDTKVPLQVILDEYFSSQDDFLLWFQPNGSDIVTAWRVRQAAFPKSGSAADDKWTSAMEWKVLSVPGAVTLE